MKRKNPKMLLPEYPRTLHLPHNPNAARDDLVAHINDVQDIFTSDNTYVEEKIDGANCAMMLYSECTYHEDASQERVEEFPIIRNRSNILTKGYNKGTPAKAQFASVWNWFYDNRHKFEELNHLLGIYAGVCGEWMYALHGVRYDKLPDVFVTYDIYDADRGIYLETNFARDMLQKAGFAIVPLLHKGKIESFEQLEKFCQEQSPFASEKREGVYVKVTNGLSVVKRFKMVRPDFIQGCHWSDKSITRNGLKK